MKKLKMNIINLINIKIFPQIQFKKNKIQFKFRTSSKNRILSRNKKISNFNKMT